MKNLFGVKRFLVVKVASLVALLALLSMAPFSAQGGISSWTALPSFSTGEVLALSSPSPQANLVLAVTSNRFYRSDDRGKSWQNVTPSGSLTQDRASIAFSPTFATDNKVLISTNQAVFLSANSGSSFSQTATDPVSGSEIIYVAAFSPTYSNDQTIFVGTSNGLYYSTNTGASWTKIGPTVEVKAISFSPTYATDKLVYLGGRDGLYRLDRQTGESVQLFHNENLELQEQIQDVSFLSPIYILAGLQHIVVVADGSLLLLRSPHTATTTYRLSSYVTYLSYGPFDTEIPNPDKPAYGLIYYALNVYPLSSSSLAVSVLTDAGFYRLTGVGYLRAGTPKKLGGLPHPEVNGLYSWPLGSDGYLFYSATGQGIFSYTLDLTPPSVWFGSVPLLSTNKSTNLSFPVSWDGSDSLSPVSAYNIWYRYGGSSYWYDWLTTSAKSANFNKAGQGKTVYFKIRAKDAAANWSGFKFASNPTVIPVDDKSTRLTTSGSWSQKTGLSGRFLGTGKRTQAKGASALFTFTGRRLWIIATKGKVFGKVRINIDDGAIVKTVDTYASSLQTRQTIFTYSWSTEKQHKVKVVNLATSGRPYFELDGIGFLR